MRMKEATWFTDSPRPQDFNLTSLQAVDEAEQSEADQSTQELGEGLKLEDTDQVKEDHVDDKRAEERDEDGEEEGKRTTKASKLMNWLRKMWTAPMGTQLRVQHEEKEDPRTGPHKYPDEADNKHILHEEERFSCTVFTKSFTGRDKFKTHLVRHSEATDFTCDDCGEQCKRKDKLRDHGKRMHNVPRKKERPVVGQGVQGDR